MSKPAHNRSQLFFSFTKYLLLAPALALLAACAGGSVERGYNPTTPVNEFDQSLLSSKPVKTVVIANVNLGPPSRNYLERKESYVDGLISNYLKSNGYQVLPHREFSQRWNNAKLIYGNPVDPTTGRVNSRTFSLLVNAVKEQMLEQTDVDGFVFSDLLEREVFFEGSMNRVARWDGITRKPAVQGPGNAVTAEFNWAQPVAASSLRIVVYNADLEPVFIGTGGLDLTEAVDTRSGNGFIRRRDILENEANVKYGIELALHPLIPMSGWPGNPE